MKCFYHSADLDGECSGAIVKDVFSECEMIGIDYSDRFPWSTIRQGEIVYMVDFSLPASEMGTLDFMCDLRWIDHHKTAIDTVDPEIDGLRREGTGACALTWRHVIGSFVPASVRLLAAYDVWDHTGSKTLPFQYGMRLEDTHPESPLWHTLFRSEDEMSRIVSNGRVVVKYRDASNRNYAESAAFECELDGLRCIAINKLYNNSQLFAAVWDEDVYDAMIAFGWHKKTWKVSLYSTKVDVSQVAVKYGGGGHTNACGFVCEELPFELRGGE